MTDKENFTDSTAKLSGMLGFAAKARRLIVGTELVCDALCRGKTKYLVVVSESASDNTKKRLKNHCENTGAQMVFVPLDEKTLGHSIGRKNASVATVAVTDHNMAKAIRNILKEGA